MTLWKFLKIHRKTVRGKHPRLELGKQTIQLLTLLLFNASKLILHLIADIVLPDIVGQTILGD